jgi:hypothetical protein
MLTVYSAKYKLQWLDSAFRTQFRMFPTYRSMYRHLHTECLPFIARVKTYMRVNGSWQQFIVIGGVKCSADYLKQCLAKLLI